MAKLTEKQKVFVNEYLIDLNATRAYKVAYPRVKKDDVAAVNGNRLLRNAKVKEYIDKRMKDREIRTEITQDKVLQELAAIAFSNGSDFAEVVEEVIMINGEVALDEEGKPKTYKTVKLNNTKDLPKDKRKAIAGIEENKYGISVKSCDKVKALELLGKHLGMFKDKIEVDANVKSTGKLDSILEELTK